MKKILIVLSVLWFLPTAFADKATFYPFNDLEKEAVDFVEGAKSSIWISAYGLSSSALQNALLDKLENVRHFDVRLIIHHGETDAIQSELKPLIENGAKLRFVNVINHHKFIIRDGRDLLNSSANFNQSSLAKKYDENTVTCTSADCAPWVNAYLHEFEAIYIHSNSKDEPLGLSEILESEPLHWIYPNLAFFTSSNFISHYRESDSKFILSSSEAVAEDQDGMVESALADAIRGAKKSALIANPRFRSRAVFDAVNEVLSRGVAVRVILDGQEHISEKKDREQKAAVEKCLKHSSEVTCYRKGFYFTRMLNEAGADVRLKLYSIKWTFPTAKQMHSKYVVIDGETLYSGSYNLSYNAEFESLENIAVYPRSLFPEVVDAFIDNFEKVSSYGEDRGGFKSLLSRFKGSNADHPKSFEPYTLTLSEADQIKEAAYSR